MVQNKVAFFYSPQCIMKQYADVLMHRMRNRIVNTNHQNLNKTWLHRRSNSLWVIPTL